jgi:hypothetical protein
MKIATSTSSLADRIVALRMARLHMITLPAESLHRLFRSLCSDLFKRLPIVLLSTICSFLPLAEVCTVRVVCRLLHRATDSVVCLGPTLPGICSQVEYKAYVERFPPSVIATRATHIHVSVWQRPCECLHVPPLSLTSPTIRCIIIGSDDTLARIPLGCAATELAMGVSTTRRIEASVFDRFPLLRRLGGGGLTHSLCSDQRFGLLHELELRSDQWPLLATVRFPLLVFLRLVFMSKSAAKVGRSVFPALTRLSLFLLNDEYQVECDCPLDIVHIRTRVSAVAPSVAGIPSAVTLLPALSPIELRMSHMDAVSLHTYPLITTRLRMLQYDSCGDLCFGPHSITFPLLEDLYIGSHSHGLRIDMNGIIAPCLTSLYVVSTVTDATLYLCAPSTLLSLRITAETVEFLPHQQPMPRVHHIGLTQCLTIRGHLPCLFPNVQTIEEDCATRCARLPQLIARYGPYWSPYLCVAASDTQSASWHVGLGAQGNV